MTGREALAFVRERGVVLISARGPVPTLVAEILREWPAGSWWAHPQGRHVFRVLQAVTESAQVLVCRLVGGKLTLVHRRLWPALVRVAPCFPPASLAQVRQVHTASGRHVNELNPYPTWVPAGLHRRATRLGEAQARAALGPWASAARGTPAGTTRSR